MGARGSYPVEGHLYSRYGGSTSCVLIEFSDCTVMLDCGSGASGINNINVDNPIHIFISHGHLDHLIGFTSCDYMYNPSANIKVYGKTRGDLTVQNQIDKIMAAPLWPVSSDSFTANISYSDISQTINLTEDIVVTTMEGFHPGGVTLYKITCQGKNIVYITDCEMGEVVGNCDDLVAFAKDCDLLICDGQYTKEELEEKRGYGHSSWQQAVLLAERSGCKELVIFHHDPKRQDDQLDIIQSQLTEIFPKGTIAKKGWSITI